MRGQRYQWIVGVMVMVFCWTAGKAEATSLWKQADHGSMTHLFLDGKARNVGDIVTILINEKAKSERDHSTTLEKDANISTTITNLLYPGSGFLQHKKVLPETDLGSQKDFEGSGELDIEDKFTASVAARVIEILPSGNLLLEGRHKIVIAEDTKDLLISGIARVRDVSPQNTISSSHLAELNIRYDGTGLLTDYNRRSLLRRFLDWANFF